MSDNSDNNANRDVDIYLRILDYKRSVGMTQWTVLSIFITASEAAFLFSLNHKVNAVGIYARILSIMIYWLGIFLYCRYRSLNKYVSSYLVDLESKIGYDFQNQLNAHFHGNGISTRKVLIVAGIGYSVFTALISFF